MFFSHCQFDTTNIQEAFEREFEFFIKELVTKMVWGSSAERFSTLNLSFLRRTNSKKHPVFGFFLNITLNQCYPFTYTFLSAALRKNLLSSHFHSWKDSHHTDLSTSLYCLTRQKNGLTWLFQKSLVTYCKIFYHLAPSCNILYHLVSSNIILYHQHIVTTCSKGPCNISFCLPLAGRCLYPWE